jgi:hypothetical protein
MRQRSWERRLPALALVGTLAVPWPALSAGPPTATLEGVIRTASRTPLAHAKLLAVDVERGAVHRSELTTAEGQFTLADLAPGTYELAVETEGGLYLVATRLELLAGVRRSVQVALGSGDGAPPVAAGATGRQAGGVWNNPYTAGAIVLGFAIVVGVLVKNATEDEPAASP